VNDLFSNAPKQIAQCGSGEPVDLVCELEAAFCDWSSLLLLVPAVTLTAPGFVLLPESSVGVSSVLVAFSPALLDDGVSVELFEADGTSITEAPLLELLLVTVADAPLLLEAVIAVLRRVLGRDPRL
jgi:hypothetical protein